MSAPSGGRVVYGSLEEQERQRLAEAGRGPDGMALGSAAIQAAIRAGNINIADSGKTEVMELTETSKEAQERHAQLLKKLEAEKRKRVLYVPTNPAEVITKLRELGEPITLFGETVADRRERLREILATKDLDQEAEKEAEGMLGIVPAGVVTGAELAGGLVPRGVAVKGQEGKMEVDNKPEGAAEAKKAELFYTVGSPELVEARKAMAAFSFARAPERLQALKRKREAYSSGRDGTDEARRLEGETAKMYDRLRRLEINQSQMGDDRPLGAIRINPGGDLAATGSWTNVVKVWDLTGNLEELVALPGHSERVSHVAWKPEEGGGGGSAMEVDSGHGLRGMVASASVDGTAKLWDLGKRAEVQTFKGHAARLAQVEFHPSGRFVGTTSWDYTWRLWDVETGLELMLQDGHYKETHAITFQADGALVATGDYSGVGHVWDLRSGKSVWVLQGHSQKIVSADFHPNGYQLATGSGENIVKLWDVRKKKNFYTLPAHTSLVSAVRFAPTSGEFLATASFDGQAKLWSTRDFRLLKQLSGHEGRLVGIDISPRDETRIVTASHDRTFKLWAESE